MGGTRRGKTLARTLQRGSAPTARDPEWLACLRESCELLWPPPATVALEIDEPAQPWGHGRRAAADATGPASREYALVPWFNRPPLLVPPGRRAAATAVRHYSGARSPVARFCVGALSLALASDLSKAVIRRRVWVKPGPGSPTIEGYLTEVMRRDIRVSMYLGPARANRKPVLQLLTSTGETVGFAKIGVTPLTSRLVRAERDALARLGEVPLKEITIPRVLHYGVWHGLDVLVLNALPTWRRQRPVPPARLAASMIELARVGGVWQETLAGSEYLRGLRASLAAADHSPEQVALAQELDALAASVDGTTLAFGSWHGDWAPWNMANIGSGLMVWDWERFASGVPHGFDALHYSLQTELKTWHRDPRSAAARCIADAPQLLSPFGIDATSARITATVYLADLATRYLVDRQAEAGSPLGAPGTWLLPAIRDEVARLPRPRGAGGRVTNAQHPSGSAPRY